MKKIGSHIFYEDVNLNLKFDFDDFAKVHGADEEGIKETLKFLEKDASNLRNQNLNRTSKTVNKKRDDEARQRRRDKKRSFADAADKKTTKIIAKRGRRDQDKVDKADKDIKDRLKEASKTGTLRLKKGGLMKKNYP